MKNISEIEGLWKAISHEKNGVLLSPEATEEMAHLLLFQAKTIQGSDGIWGVVSFNGMPKSDVIQASVVSLCRLTKGENYIRSPSFHVWAGGAVYLGPEELPASIDFASHLGDYVSALPGIYQYDGELLAICLADMNARCRPAEFDSSKMPGSSLTVYVRECVLHNEKRSTHCGN